MTFWLTYMVLWLALAQSLPQRERWEWQYWQGAEWACPAYRGTLG